MDSHTLDIHGVSDERIAEQFRNKPRLRALLASYLDMVQQAANAVSSLAALRGITHASGVQLDRLGELVGQDRDGAADERFRALIRLRAQLNHANGTVDEVRQITTVLLRSSVTHVRCSWLFVEVFAFGISRPTAQSIQAHCGLISSAVAAGVCTRLHYYPQSIDTSFRFDGGEASGFDGNAVMGATIDAASHTPKKEAP